jgi:hypothetical protein
MGQVEFPDFPGYKDNAPPGLADSGFSLARFFQVANGVILLCGHQKCSLPLYFLIKRTTTQRELKESQRKSSRKKKQYK